MSTRPPESDPANFSLPSRRPPLGGLSLLVYRECPCGRWCATGEGERHPICPRCGGPFVPGGGNQQGPAMFGADTTESRRLRGLAFVGFLTGEVGAVGLLSKVRGFLGLTPWVTERVGGKDGGHYTENERRARAEEDSDWVEIP